MSHALLVDEGFWEVLEPLLPDRPPRRIGRPRVSDRAAFTAIVFVLVTGVPWADGAQGDRLLGRDRVAAAARLAGRRRVGASAPRTAAALERRSADRLVARDRRL